MSRNHDVETIYRDFHPKILRYLQRLCGEEDAADLAQTVFLNVSRSLDSFRGESSLSTWIYQIATNAARDHAGSSVARQREWEEPFDEDSLPEEVADAGLLPPIGSTSLCLTANGMKRIHERGGLMQQKRCEEFLLLHQSLDLLVGVARLSIGAGAFRAALARVRNIARELAEHGRYSALFGETLSKADVDSLLSRSQ
ncbi:MAG: hypothetical protein A2X58_11285 [Nitrospirae bacterium GWC2_56_14]|nr:MAG: hypothetical protein A2X58_11285 [Nitrospirae bacterium GWC2_56_14]